MLTTAVERYVQVQAATSSPGEILLALYDGLFRFLNQSKLLLSRGHLPRAREQLSRAHAIVSELYLALDHALAPELCGQLQGVYGFCLDRINHANHRGDEAAIDEVLRVLTPLREAWSVAVPEAQRQAASGG